MHQVLLEKETYHYHTHACQIHLEPRFQQFQIQLRKDVQFNYDGEVLILSLKESGYGRGQRHVEIKHIDILDIHGDISSLEIFINKGGKSHLFLNKKCLHKK